MQREQLMTEAVQGLSRIIKAMDDFSKRAESVHGVTGPQLWALWELDMSGGLTVSALAGRMYVHPSTVSGIAERLEAKGLVRRLRLSDDQRRVRLEITPEGRELLERAPSPTRRLLLGTLEQMPDRQLRALSAGLGALADALRPTG